MDFLQHHIEAIIFCAQTPVSEEEIMQCMKEMFNADIPMSDVEHCLHNIIAKYEAEIFPFAVYKIGGGYQFLTKPAYQASIAIYLKQKSKKRLSASALETLAIVAYKQPVSKSLVEQIRGVNCDYAFQKLLEKELIEIKGKADTVGKPVLYGTSSKFMDYFGINSIAELPTPKDIATEDNQIGGESTKE
ncbi:MAG: SMC-Scp complex subunit ScpB [Cytophagales bacterium]|nr:SMC-Scp complex subunit ScpB [Cytophagales bacterium]